MKKTGKAVTIMQRSTDATWEYYTMHVLIKNDVLKLDGTRFIDVVFLTEPNQLGYYLLMQPLFFTQRLKKYSLSRFIRKIKKKYHG